MYILDQVRALESEMLHRIKQQGLDITPRILIVRSPLISFPLSNSSKPVWNILKLLLFCRLLVFFPMLLEQRVTNDLRKYLEQSIRIFSGSPLEMKRELSGNGFQDLKSGLTWKPSLRYTLYSVLHEDTLIWTKCQLIRGSCVV